MTITTNDRRFGPILGNGVTTQFGVDFPISADVDAIVEVRDTSTGTDTTKLLGVHYTITAKSASGFNVVFATPPTSSEQLIVRAGEAITQDVDFNSFSLFPAEANEGALDKLTREVQDLREGLGRSLKLSPFDAPVSDVRLPPLEGQAGNAIIINGTEDGVAFGALALQATLNVAPGWQRVAQSVGDQLITGVTGNQTLSPTYTIPANTFLAPGDAIRVKMTIAKTNPNNAASVNFRVGGAAILTVTMPTNATEQICDFEFHYEAISSSAQRGTARLTLATIAGASFAYDPHTADSAIDMAAADRLVTITINPQNIGDSFTIKTITVERLGLPDASAGAPAFLISEPMGAVIQAASTAAAVGVLNAVLEVATKAELQGLEPGIVDAVLVRGRDAANDIPARVWRWSGSDLSAGVTADTRNARYVAPFGQTGASGAWVGDLPEGEAVFDLTHYLDGDDYQAITAGDIDSQDLADVMTAVRAWGDAALAWLDDAPDYSRAVMTAPPGIVALRDEVWSDTALATIWSGLALKRLTLQVKDTLWRCKDWRAHDPEGNGKRATRTMPTGAWLAGEPVPAAVWRLEAHWDVGQQLVIEFDTLRVMGQHVTGGIGEGPSAAAATDPMGVHIIEANLMKGDGHNVDSIGGSALWIDSAFNSDWESEELKGGWQPVEGGVILSGRAGAPTGDVIFDYTDAGDGTGTIEAFSYTDWTDSSTETPIAYFAAGHVDKHFYIDNAMDGSGTLAVEIDAIGGSPSGSSATATILGSSTTIGTSAAKVSGSFGPIRGTISASSNSLVLSDPVDSTPDASGPVDSDPNLIGRYVYVEGAGDDARSNMGGLIARITAVDYTAGVMTWTLSESAAFSVSGARVIMNPVKFLGTTGDSGFANVNNTGVARSRVETFAAWNAIPALYISVVHHVETDSKWHGCGEGKTTWGQGFNFAGQARCAILDDCRAFAIYGMELSHGYGHDAGKILVCGEDGSILIEGFRQTQSNATMSPPVSAVVEIDPLSTHTAVLVRLGGEHSTLSAQQSIATYGANGDATMLDHRLVQRSTATVPPKLFPAGIQVGNDASTLQHFEDAQSWTPVLEFATPSDAVVTPTLQAGRYWRLGSLVFFSGIFQGTLNAYGGSPAGARISGLPYAATAGSPNYPVTGMCSGVTISHVQFAPRISNGAQTISLLGVASAGALVTYGATQIPASSNVSFEISGFYRTSAA